jgi:Acyl-CoA carboxylase epsilon subunit
MTDEHPQERSGDEPQPHEPHEPHFKVLKGEPTEEELAALIGVLAGAAGGQHEPEPEPRNMWGHAVDKLRYESFSWQRVTLMERTHMRR